MNSQGLRRLGARQLRGPHGFTDYTSNTAANLFPISILLVTHFKLWFSSILLAQHRSVLTPVGSTGLRSPDAPFRTEVFLLPDAGTVGYWHLSGELLPRTCPGPEMACPPKGIAPSQGKPTFDERRCRTALKDHPVCAGLAKASRLWHHTSPLPLLSPVYLTSLQVLIPQIPPAH